MEHLDLLQKIYQYGETLSSEEMNQIVSYINVIIDALNRLISNNNGVNTGHCEIRYKNFTEQPTKPATGTNGLSDGWSSVYSLPNTRIGETAWMTLCFMSGDNIYGEWSTPVCISWGSVVGQQGPQGEAGLSGAFTSRVFKRQNTKPATPVGGTYNHPIPNGWFDGIPQGNAIIWSSTCTFYGNGTDTGWSEPAQESDTATLDIEFSPSATMPLPPAGNTPFSNHEAEGWYDPNSPNFSLVGNMIWRAERKVSNGEYDGDWTITRIFGEQGEKGLTGKDGGHYEFRYKNYISTQDYPIPTKPATGSDGTSNGWSREQTALTELEIKSGTFTWMTQCYQDEDGLYGTWTDPIRITGANGIDGEDGTEQEFIYTRNNTGTLPPAPPTTQVNDWWGTDPISGIFWTDDPQGVNDEMQWEYVSTRVKEANVWSPYSAPVVWAKWGKQGRIGQMSYLAGVWNPNTTYTKTAEKNPVVYYNDNYYYLKGEITKNTPSISSTGQNPLQYPNVWAQAENFEMVFTDILFVNTFAKLASFIISGDWLISRNGTLYDSSGNAHDIDESHSWGEYNVNNAYTYFDPSYPDSNHSGVVNFVPAIAIDSLSGRAFFWKGKFTGDVYANSLHLGNNSIDKSKINGLQTDLDNLSGLISNLQNDVNGLSGDIQNLPTSNVSVSSSTIAGGLTKREITVGNQSFYVIEGGDFVLTNVGVQGNSGSYYLSNQGLLQAHNAIIYGTIYATAGTFSGDVYANAFRAGDPGGLNVKVEGSAISFNYGGDARAWFTPFDSNGNDTGGLFLYIKDPDDPTHIITIDFTNLTFKNVNNSQAIAIQQNNIYSDYTNSSCDSSVFISSIDSKYYRNSQLTSLLDNRYNIYEKMEDGYCIVADNGTYRIYPASFFTKINIVSGVKTTVDANYYVSIEKNGSKYAAYGASSSSSLSSDQVHIGDGGLISDNQYAFLNESPSYYLAREGTSGGGKITVVTSISHSGGVTYDKKYNVTMHS